MQSLLLLALVAGEGHGAKQGGFEQLARVRMSSTYILSGALLSEPVSK